MCVQCASQWRTVHCTGEGTPAGATFPKARRVSSSSSTKGLANMSGYIIECSLVFPIRPILVPVPRLRHSVLVPLWWFLRRLAVCIYLRDCIPVVSI